MAERIPIRRSGDRDSLLPTRLGRRVAGRLLARSARDAVADRAALDPQLPEEERRRARR